MSKENNSPDKFSGIWQSTYTYHSSVSGTERESKQYVRAHTKDGLLIMETIPEVNDAYMHARFSLDDNIATGTWQEGTSPKGDYRGVVYHGAGQLIISDDKKNLKGKWVGFGKKMEVKTGSWEFTYLGEDLSVVPDHAAGQ